MNKFMWALALIIGTTGSAWGQAAGDVTQAYEQARSQAMANNWREGVTQESRLASGPDGFTLAYSICGTEDEACAYSQATLSVDMPFAYRGHYQAQRNLAFCLIDGCDGAVTPNKPLGCAWRIVILASGSPQVDDSDRANLDLCFGQLDPIGYATMRSQARSLHQVVYGHAIDPAWLAD